MKMKTRMAKKAEAKSKISLPLRVLALSPHHPMWALSLHDTSMTNAPRCAITSPPSRNQNTQERSMRELDDGRILIVGLGSPGAKDDGKRHNIGRRLVQELEQNEGGALVDVAM